jgi:protein-S-isoprenylcysteine O-methyltransferase Ste14
MNIVNIKKVPFKKLRLWLVYPIFIILPFVAHITPASWTMATLLILAGLAVRFWASGYITKSHRLTTSGPYAYMRNPLYVGNLLLGIGIVLVANNVWLFLIYLVAFYFFYSGTIREEEAVLSEKFGAAFKEYIDNVPVFFPTGKRYTKGEQKTFEGKQSFKNGEFIRIFGFLLLPPFFYLWQSLVVHKGPFDAGDGKALTVFLVFFALMWFNIFIRRQSERKVR